MLCELKTCWKVNDQWNPKDQYIFRACSVAATLGELSWPTLFSEQTWSTSLCNFSNLCGALTTVYLGFVLITSSNVSDIGLLWCTHFHLELYTFAWFFYFWSFCLLYNDYRPVGRGELNTYKYFPLTVNDQIRYLENQINTEIQSTW